MTGVAKLQREKATGEAHDHLPRDCAVPRLALTLLLLLRSCMTPRDHYPETPRHWPPLAEGPKGHQIAQGNEQDCHMTHWPIDHSIAMIFSFRCQTRAPTARVSSRKDRKMGCARGSHWRQIRGDLGLLNIGLLCVIWPASSTSERGGGSGTTFSGLALGLAGLTPSALLMLIPIVHANTLHTRKRNLPS